MNTEFWYGVLAGIILASIIFWRVVCWSVRGAQKSYEINKQKFEEEQLRVVNDAYKQGVRDALDKTKVTLTKMFNAEQPKQQGAAEAGLSPARES